MAKNGVYTKMVLSQNGGNLDDTKDADRVSDDEDYSEDETVSRKSWMAQQLGLDGLVPVGLGRTGSIHSRKSAEIGRSTISTCIRALLHDDALQKMRYLLKMRTLSTFLY